MTELAGLAAPYLDGTELVADLSAGLELAVEPALGLPEDGAIRYWRTDPQTWQRAAREPAETASAATLVVVTAGPDPERHLPWHVCADVLAALPDGTRALILLGYPVTDLPLRRALDMLAGQRCLALAAGAVDCPGLAGPEPAAGLVTERASGGPQLAHLNEYLLTSVVAAALQARLAALGASPEAVPGRGPGHRAGSGRPAGGPPASSRPGSTQPAGTQPDRGADDQPDRDRLARALRAAQRELVAAHAAAPPGCPASCTGGGSSAAAGRHRRRPARERGRWGWHWTGAPPASVTAGCPPTPHRATRAAARRRNAAWW
jgi:hypothetical protein